jgi:RNA polymerase sigma factor (TIGR02999 family)
MSVLLYTAGVAGTPDVSLLLREWAGGDQKAREQVVPLVYDALRRLAAHHLAHEQHAVTLQPTALVHEAYMRMVGRATPDWNDKNHFFGIAARLMRQILVDHARARRSEKRGGGAIALDLEQAAMIAPPGRGADVIALNDALDALEKIDPRKAAIIELRHFGGLTEEEAGLSLGMSVATVRRQARMAEAWLHAEMTTPARA